MMMLLQWPCSISPSRNHTPGAMIRSVSGVAAEPETNSATNPSVVKSNSSNDRRCVIDPLAHYSTPVFLTGSEQIGRAKCDPEYAGCARRSEEHTSELQ